MNFLVYLLVGLIAGVLAKAIMPGSAKEPGGWLMTMILGIVGGLVGGFVGGMFGIGSSNFVASILLATVGAIIVIAIARMLSRRSA